MKKNISLLALIFLMASFAFAQPTIEWQTVMGGSALDVGKKVIPTRDGGYFVIGRSLSSDIIDSSLSYNIHPIFHHSAFSAEDIYCAKLDRKGKIQWQKLYGSVGLDFANDVIQTSDGGFLIAGLNGSIDGDAGNTKNIYDFWIFKIDALGGIQWDKGYGGSSGDVITSMIQTKDGGYVLTGFTYSFDGDVAGNHGADDTWIIKIDASGALLWQKCFGGGDHDYSQVVIELEDGSLIVGGSTNSTDGDVFGTHGWDDYWLIKLNHYGDFLWQHCYGGSQRNELCDVVTTPNGGFMLCGYSASTDGDVSDHILRYDFWIVNVNSVGDIIWEHSYGGEFNDATQFNANAIPTSDYSGMNICTTKDGGYAIVGSTASYSGDVSGNHGKNDIWMVKIDGEGTLQWQKCLGGSEDDYGNCIYQSADGGYVVLGYSYSIDGDLKTHYGSTGNGTFSGQGPCDVWLVKLSPVTDVETKDTGNPLMIYPNPTNGRVILNSELITGMEQQAQLKVFNITGQCVFSSTLEKNYYDTYEVDLSALPAGLYTLQVIDQSQTLNQKLIIR